MVRRSLLCSLFFALCACGEALPDLSGDGLGDPPGSVTQIAPVHPQASISGFVVDALSGLPLDGITVHATSGTFDATTTTVAGAWSLADLPAGGEGRISLSGEGFVAASAEFSTDDSAGTFPSDNNTHDQGIFGLLRSAPVSLMLIGSSGEPLAGVQVALRLPFSYFKVGASPRPMGTVSVTATTSGDGTASITGLPDVSAPLHHLIGNQSLFVAAAANPASEGAQATLLLSPVLDLGRYPAFVLSHGELTPLMANGSNLRVLSSNAHDLIERGQPVSMIEVDEAIRVVFDRPVDPATAVVHLSDASGATSLPINITWDERHEVMTVQPIGAPALIAGREVNLALSALPADNGNAYSGSANLFTPGTESPFPNEDVAVVDWDDRNEDQMINGGDYLTLHAEIPIGGRSAGGSSTHGSRLVQYVFLAPLDQDNSVLGEQDYSVNDIPVYVNASLLEENPIGDATTSGFTRTVRLVLPPAANFSSGMGLSVRIRLIFDNPFLLTHQNRCRSVTGAPLASYDVRLNLP